MDLYDRLFEGAGRGAAATGVRAGVVAPAGQADALLRPLLSRAVVWRGSPDSERTNNAAYSLAAAVAGLGITRVLSFHVADHLRNGTLVRVLKEFESPAVPVCLVHAGQGLVPMKVRAFLDFAAPRLKMRIS